MYIRPYDYVRISRGLEDHDFIVNPNENKKVNKISIFNVFFLKSCLRPVLMAGWMAKLFGKINVSRLASTVSFSLTQCPNTDGIW